MPAQTERPHQSSQIGNPSPILGVLPCSHITRSEQETMELAGALALKAMPGDIIFLSGPLGAGKTHFVRGFCHGLGLKQLYEVDSPTYTVLNHYEVANGVDHLDLYRLCSWEDLEEIDLEGMLNSDTIKLIEWPERLVDYPIPTRFLVRFETLGETQRRIQISEAPLPST